MSVKIIMVDVLKLALILLEVLLVNVMMDMISLMVALQTVLVLFYLRKYAILIVIYRY